jgi:hypothetical protein
MAYIFGEQYEQNQDSELLESLFYTLITILILLLSVLFYILSFLHQVLLIQVSQAFGLPTSNLLYFQFPLSPIALKTLLKNHDGNLL